MQRPAKTPIGLLLADVVKNISRAFDDAMAEAGGSMPEWRILIALKTKSQRNQRELAEFIGIKGATLTHHLNAMEADGLLTRRRDPDNRRIHVVEMTDAGEKAFFRMAAAAQAFDKRLRDGINPDEIAVLEDLLNRLQSNATP
jgi:MarR family transcriptional regulator for hemolysin